MLRAGVSWLINKYKLYIVLRERLLMDTPHLRGSLSAARPGPEAVTDPAYRRRGAWPGSQASVSLLRLCHNMRALVTWLSMRRVYLVPDIISRPWC